jgi:hypothetical protein
MEERRRSEMGRMGKGTKVWDDKGLWGGEDRAMARRLRSEPMAERGGNV